MNMVKMSISGAVLIFVIVCVRALLINRLPKRTFLVLWAVALLRLLLPFSVPSGLSAYTLVDKAVPYTAEPAARLLSGIPDKPAPAYEGSLISPWYVVWEAGAILLAIIFAVSYIRLKREFSMSLPVKNEFCEDWLKNHSISRKIDVRQSDGISAPLSYGILRPVILMPANTDWKNADQLNYVFAHEYIHIRRFDSAAKLILILALCLHWFNPMVWVMYILANRDMELACDEAVVRLFGEETRSSYALALISMEEKQSGFNPLCSGFSKNAIEDRITAVMKTKRASLIAVITAVALIAAVSVVFATSSNNNSLPAIPNTDFTDEEYSKLSALRFDGYRSMTVSEYQNRVWTMTDTEQYHELLERFSQNEQFFDMRDTNKTSAFYFYVLEPLTAERWESRDFGGYVEARGKNEPVSIEYAVTFEIENPDTLTVGEYEDAWNGLSEGVSEFMRTLSADTLQSQDSMTEAGTMEILNLAEKYSKNGLQISLVYVSCTPFTYQDGASDETIGQINEELETELAQFAPFGLTYSVENTNGDPKLKMYFENTEVRGIYNSTTGEWITDHMGTGGYSPGAVELEAVYENGRLAGLKKADNQQYWDEIRTRETSDYDYEMSNLPYADEEDYASLFALMTPGYKSMSVEAFNRLLLDWSNESYDRHDRILEGAVHDDFLVSLSPEQEEFVKVTFIASNTENAMYVNSINNGTAEKDPSFGSFDLYREASQGGAYGWCRLYFEMNYHIEDKGLITIGERDKALSDFADKVNSYWYSEDIDVILKMKKSDAVKKLKEISDECSDGKITITVDSDYVHFENLDERDRI